MTIFMLNFKFKNRCEQDSILLAPSCLFLLTNAVADPFDFVTVESR